MRGSDFAQIDTICILHALITLHEAVAGLDGVSWSKWVRSAVSGGAWFIISGFDGAIFGVKSCCGVCIITVSTCSSRGNHG